MLSRIRTKKIHPENFIFQESHLFSNRRKWNKIVFFHIFVSSTGKHHLLLFGVVCGSCNTLAYIFYSIRYTCKGNKCKVSTNPFHFQFLCHLDGNDDFLCFLCSSVSSFLFPMPTVLKSIWKENAIVMRSIHVFSSFSSR